MWNCRYQEDTNINYMQQQQSIIIRLPGEVHDSNLSVGTIGI